MANNGDANQSLQNLEAAITGAQGEINQRRFALRAKPEVPTEAPGQRVGIETIAAFAEALAERVTAAGKYAREHGAYIDEVSIAFARQLQAEAEQYAASLLASEQRKMQELQKIMGKTGQ